MKAKSSYQIHPMSYGPTIDDLRAAIRRGEDDGVQPADMLLRLTLRDVSLIKRSPSVGVDEVSFAGGDMRFLGVRIVQGPYAISALEAPALPEEPAAAPVEAPAKKTRKKAVAAKPAAA